MKKKNSFYSLKDNLKLFKLYRLYLLFSILQDKVSCGFNPNRSLEKVSCHFLMTAIRKIALYLLDS